MEHDLKHADEALATMAQQFSGLPNIEGFFRALASGAQGMEDAIWDLFQDRWIDAATGVQLDNLGVIIGRGRAGMSDDTYRIYLKMQIQLNRGDGSPEQLIKLFALIVTAGDVVIVEEQFPAAIVLRISSSVGVVPATAAEFAKILGQAKAAGVRAILEWSSVPLASTFTFFGGPGLGFENGDWASATLGA